MRVMEAEGPAEAKVVERGEVLGLDPFSLMALGFQLSFTLARQALYRLSNSTSHGLDPF
jgi:hypothetical protein